MEDDGQTVTYQCSPGYPLVGNDTRECNMTSGDWYPDEPRCGCGPPPYLANGTRMWTNTNVNSTVEYTCNSDYNLDGDMQLTCNSTGHWQFNEFPSCSNSKCFCFVFETILNTFFYSANANAKQWLWRHANAR